MAPTGMEAGRGELSGSRSRAGERKRRPDSSTGRGELSGSRSRAGERKGRRRRTPTPEVTDSSSEAQSQRGKRKAAPEQYKGGREKRARAADKSREDVDEKKGATSMEAAAASGSETSAVSSPLRWPRINYPETLSIRMDPAIEDAYEDLTSKYREKKKKQLELVTIDPYVPRSCMENINLAAVRESATEIVLEAAKVLFSFSSYVDGELMAKSSGFLIDWDEDTKVGTVLTSALLICTKSPSLDKWLVTGEYMPNAEVYVHLLDKDETTIPAHLLHYDKHFKVALFKVHMDSCAKIPSFNKEVRYGQDVFVLGRDKDLNLKISHGMVQFMGPTTYGMHHFMSMGCVIDKFGIGGLVIDFNGQVLGMVSIPGIEFVHSSIILKCLDMWKKYKCVPRLHIGMKFSAMKFLDLAHVEKIYRKCKIRSGLIVKEVSHGSVAEKSGIRIGDIIVSINGECITTTVDLEKFLLLICENHLDRNIGIGSSVEIPVDVFHTRKGSSRTINLRLNISDEVEVFVKGDYLVSAKDCA